MGGSSKGTDPEAEASKLLGKAIHELGVKWNFRQDGKKLIENSCLSKNPEWLDDLLSLQGFLIAVVCLLLAPITVGYGTIFANYDFTPKAALRAILDKEECVVSSAHILQSMGDPRANCYSLCQGLERIPVPENLTPEKFLSDYAYTGRPVLIRDATRNWTAKDHFSFQFFKRVFQSYAEKLERWNDNDGDDGVSDEDSRDFENCQFFPYKTEFKNLPQFLNISEARSRLDPSEKSYYVGWNNCFRQVVDQLRHHYSRPAFLPTDSESSMVDWIFMGGSSAKTGGGAPVHIDKVDRPSWQAVVSGNKTWFLYPPYECESVCPHEMAVDMNQGDVLVVDTNLWWHGTNVKQGVVTIAIGSEYD